MFKREVAENYRFTITILQLDESKFRGFELCISWKQGDGKNTSICRTHFVPSPYHWNFGFTITSKISRRKNEFQRKVIVFSIDRRKKEDDQNFYCVGKALLDLTKYCDVNEAVEKEVNLTFRREGKPMGVLRMKFRSVRVRPAPALVNQSEIKKELSGDEKEEHLTEEKSSENPKEEKEEDKKIAPPQKKSPSPSKRKLTKSNSVDSISSIDFTSSSFSSDDGGGKEVKPIPLDQRKKKVHIPRSGRKLDPSTKKFDKKKKFSQKAGKGKNRSKGRSNMSQTLPPKVGQRKKEFKFEYPKSERQFQRIIRKIQTYHKKEKRRIIDTSKNHLSSTMSKVEKLKKNYLGRIQALEQNINRAKKMLEKAKKKESKEEYYAKQVKELQNMLNHKKKVNDTKGLRMGQLLEKLENDLNDAMADKIDFRKRALQAEAESEHLRTEVMDNQRLFDERIQNLMKQQQSQLLKQKQSMEESFKQTRLEYEKMMDDLIEKEKSWKNRNQQQPSTEETEESEKKSEPNGLIEHEYDLVKKEVTFLNFRLDNNNNKNLKGILTSCYLRKRGTHLLVPKITKLLNDRLFRGEVVKLAELFFEAVEERFQRILFSSRSSPSSIVTEENNIFHIGWYLFHSLFFLYQVMWEIPGLENADQMKYNNKSTTSTPRAPKEENKKKNGIEDEISDDDDDLPASPSTPIRDDRGVFSILYPPSRDERNEYLSILSSLPTMKKDDDSRSLLRIVERCRSWVARSYYIMFISTLDVLIKDVILFLESLNHNNNNNNNNSTSTTKKSNGEEMLRRLLIRMNKIVIQPILHHHHIFPSISIHFLRCLVQCLDVFVANYYFFGVSSMNDDNEEEESQEVINPMLTLQIKMSVSKIENLINRAVNRLQTRYNNEFQKKKKQKNNNKKKKNKKRLFKIARQCCDMCAMGNKLDVFLKDIHLRNYVCPDLTITQITNILSRIKGVEGSGRGRSRRRRIRNEGVEMFDILLSLYDNVALKGDDDDDEEESDSDDDDDRRSKVQKKKKKKKRTIIFRTRVYFCGDDDLDSLEEEEDSIFDQKKNKSKKKKNKSPKKEEDEDDGIGVNVWRRRFLLFEIGVEERKALIRALNFV